MSRIQRVAFALSLLPMTLGGAVLGAWLLTRRDWLMQAGLAVIWLGMFVCLVVPVLLVVGWRQSVLAGAAQRRFRHTLLILAVLLASVPACLGAMVVVVVTIARFTVTLRNHAETAWQGVVLDGGGVREVLPAIPPHATVVQHLWFVNDGELTLRQAEDAQPLVVEGYVTHGWGGAVEVVRDATCKVVVATTVR